MARIEASTHIEATVERVWDVLTAWEAQASWMTDARSIAVLSPHRTGTEVVLRVRTDVAPGLVLTDDMVVTEWEEHRRIGIRHLGHVIRGIGSFDLVPTADGTHFTWWEELLVPFGGLGDALASVALRPWVERLFRISLAALKRECEAAPAPRG